MNKIVYYIDEVEKLKQDRFVFPVTCEIDPSNRCMLDCKFCMYADYLKASRQDLSWDIYVDVLGDLRLGGCRSITFTGGGEPLMNERFNSMVDLAASMGFEIGLITNGVRLDRVNNPSRFKFIRVSLDAESIETYKAVKGKDYFERVVHNIKGAVARGATVGVSYVICDENIHGVREAQRLAEKIIVAYIQFKPAVSNHASCFPAEALISKKTIVMGRYKADSYLPCKIAGLIGIIGADGCVYYCCQHRGRAKYKLGSLRENDFYELWCDRILTKPNLQECPQCRYMNYAKAYEKLTTQNDTFFEHRKFL